MRGRSLVLARRPALGGTVGLMFIRAGAAGLAHPAFHATGFARWRAADGAFGGWQMEGVSLAPDGSLQLDPAAAWPETDPYGPGGYAGQSYHNGGRFVVGEALGPAAPAGGAGAEAIASWNADTPAGTWLETLIRAQAQGRWTAWYSLGVWAADSSTVRRHSVRQQRDGDASVATDTLVLGPAPAEAFQLKLRLCSAEGGASGLPSVRTVALACSATPSRPEALAAGNPAWWNKTLAIPACSQMVYPDGGEAWCSPTSVAMVLAYWEREVGPCEAPVRRAVAGVYDGVYRGHGNWPFNTAYAATFGLEAYVARLSGLAQAEPWLDAGVPLIISFGWQRGQLTGAPLPASNGHLAVLAGFDAGGNPVMNDPAAPNNAGVRRTYPRRQLESLWLEHSGGAAYLIYPPDWPVPQL